MSVDPGSRGWNEHRHKPGPVPMDAGLTLRSGIGVPPSSLGANGDFYLRQDGTAGAAIYQKRVGAWIAVA